MQAMASHRSCISRAVVSVCAFFCWSCGLMPSEVDYRKADKLATPEAYREYLKKHPEGYLSARIAYRLLPAGPIDAYRQFIKQYPDSNEAKMAASWIEYLQREEALYAEFGRAGASDAFMLVKKHGLAGIEHHFMLLVSTKWARVPLEENTSLRRGIVDPLRDEFARTKKTMAGTKLNTRIVFGSEQYFADLLGIYYVDSNFLLVEAAIVNGKKYSGLAWFSGDGKDFFFTPRN